MCQVPPVAAFGGVVLAIFVQVVLAVVSVFTQQWVNCNFSWASEFSFGLSKFKIRFELGGIEFLNQDPSISDMASWVDDLEALVQANGYVRIATLLGMSLGIVAGGLAVYCVVSTTQFKRAYRNWVTGLVFADALFVMMGLLIYEMGVCPAIHDLGIQQMIEQIMTHTGLSFGTLQDYLFHQAVSESTQCTDQSRMTGALLAIVQMVVLFITGVLLQVAVDFGEEQARMVPMGYGPGMPKGKGKGMQMQDYGPGPGGQKPGGYGPGGPGPSGPPPSDQQWGPGQGAYGGPPGQGQGGYGGPPGQGGYDGGPGYGAGPGYGPGAGKGGGMGMPPPPPMGYGPR